MGEILRRDHKKIEQVIFKKRSFQWYLDKPASSQNFIEGNFLRWEKAVYVWNILSGICAYWMCCAIWYHLYNLKNTHGGVFLLKPATLLNVTPLHVCFHVFLIVQMVRNRTTHHICNRKWTKELVWLEC